MHFGFVDERLTQGLGGEGDVSVFGDLLLMFVSSCASIDGGFEKQLVGVDAVYVYSNHPQCHHHHHHQQQQQQETNFQDHLYRLFL